MATVDHPLKAGVDQLRIAILAANPGMTEHIKWNAPSLCYAGQDRVTFRLHPKGSLQLIFHRGAKVRGDSADFMFEDLSGLLTWLGPDRAIITLPDLAAVAAQQASIVELVNQWVAV